MPILPGAEPFAHDGSTEIGVLLCHGFTGTPQSMAPWGARLAEIGWSTRCPLLPGHGTRWQDLNRTDWPSWYAAVETAYDSLAERCSAVFAFGLSMGGTLALRLAVSRPSVAGLVLVNPSVTTERRDAPLLPVLSRIIPSMPGIANDIKKPGVTELAYGRLPLRAAASLSKLWQEVRRDLARIEQPLLLFRSAVDHVVEPVNARIVLDGVSSTDTQEVVLPDSHHVATLDNDAPAIFEGSVEFVRRVVSSSPASPASASVSEEATEAASRPREGM
ncbi:MAG TPA: alpha/beta fold hydrolase [Pseudonocardiaceae bacterium]|nr:alpha/beta fold hydrolase [Pseudonocardiaceae bacterium]